MLIKHQLLLFYTIRGIIHLVYYCFFIYGCIILFIIPHFYFLVEAQALFSCAMMLNEKLQLCGNSLGISHFYRSVTMYGYALFVGLSF